MTLNRSEIETLRSAIKIFERLLLEEVSAGVSTSVSQKGKNKSIAERVKEKRLKRLLKK